jgi:hypothetical protein
MTFFCLTIWKRYPEKNACEKVVGHEMPGKHELAWSWGLELRRLFIKGLEVFFVEMPVREYFGGPVPQKASITQRQKKNITHMQTLHTYRKKPRAMSSGNSNNFCSSGNSAGIAEYSSIYQIIAGCHRMLSCER